MFNLELFYSDSFIGYKDKIFNRLKPLSLKDFFS